MLRDKVRGECLASKAYSKASRTTCIYSVLCILDSNGVQYSQDPYHPVLRPDTISLLPERIPTWGWVVFTLQLLLSFPQRQVLVLPLPTAYYTASTRRILPNRAPSAADLGLSSLPPIGVLNTWPLPVWPLRLLFYFWERERKRESDSSDWLQISALWSQRVSWRWLSRWLQETWTANIHMRVSEDPVPAPAEV